ncbi:MAG: hypothetical protein WDM87_06875 [Terracidiphilus sp.]
METQTYCAYNQTRECFLGLNVKVGDLPSTHVAELMLEKPLKSGEGVWMKPFRGIAATAMPAPLDLIYLDDECRVIDMAESFPTFQVSSSSPRPESVLALRRTLFIRRKRSRAISLCCVLPRRWNGSWRDYRARAICRQLGR